MIDENIFPVMTFNVFLYVINSQGFWNVCTINKWLTLMPSLPWRHCQVNIIGTRKQRASITTRESCDLAAPRRAGGAVYSWKAMRHACVLTTTRRGCVRYVKDNGWFGGSLTGLIVPLPACPATPAHPRGHADLRTWRSNENTCPIYGNRSRIQVHDTNTRK